MKQINNQKGFTLVEIAIVLVIIGLLLGGVLKGQELITNAKVKNLINDLRGVSAAYNAYMDRYRAVPGDDSTAANKFTGAVNGGGNGTITGLYTAVAAPAAANESNNFWQHVRMAGLANGIATATVANPPTNAVGGLIGVQSSAAGVSTYGMTGPVVCAGGIPWSIAQSIDAQIDDGSSDTGTVRTGLAGAVNLATVAAVSGVYGTGIAPPAAPGLHTVCMQM